MNGGVNKTVPEDSKLKIRSSKRIMGKKRIWNFDDSSDDNNDDDDDIQIVTPTKKIKHLTGAIRTFNKPVTNCLTPVTQLQEETPVTPSQETQDESHGKENCSPINTSLFSLDKSQDSSDYREFPVSPPSNSLQSPVIDTSQLSDQDKETMFLKRKMSCVLRAYHIQSWKCTQEREELRHNMNLIIMEMRACLEADKKQAIEALSKTFEQERRKCIEETKKKQWCASCLMESRYACCWNTSYCSVSCQKRHFPEHRAICTQVKNKNSSESVEGKSKATTSTIEGSENKSGGKVIIVNMKPSDAAKVVASSADLSTNSSSPQPIAPKPQLQLLAAKNPIQLASTPCTSSPIQFFIAPMKSTPVLSSAPSKSSIEIVKPSAPLSVPVIITAAAKPSLLSPTSSVATIIPSSTSTFTSSSDAITRPFLTSTSSSVTPTIQSSPFTSAPSPVVTSASSLKELGQEQNLDTTRLIKSLRTQNCDLGTALNLLKQKNLESSLSLVKNKAERKKQLKSKNQSQPKEETSLEEIYFPCPPTVTFEGYDAVSPEPNLVIDEFEDIKDDSDAEISDTRRYLIPEQDVVLSDNDEVNNEMVSIGRGIEIKAKFLNKCIVYGCSPKKLTRCLVDVIFPDIKLLATCSALGQKSNVTKLTRAALPARKVYAIIDFVGKRFPQATRSEIVLAINMKCKEARIILNRMNSESKIMERKSWTKDEKDKSTVALTTTASSTISSLPVTTKIIPNLVCVKSSGSFQTSKISALGLLKKSARGPNIMGRNPQILIRPRPIISNVGSAAIVSTPSLTFPIRRKETVKELLKNKLQVPTSTSLNVAVTNESKDSRSLLILGSAVNPVRQADPVQNPTSAVSATIKQ